MILDNFWRNHGAKYYGSGKKKLRKRKGLERKKAGAMIWIYGWRSGKTKIIFQIFQIFKVKIGVLHNWERFGTFKINLKSWNSQINPKVNVDPEDMLFWSSYE